MRANETTYPFSAFSKAPTCAAAEQSCDRINFFPDVCPGICPAAELFQLRAPDGRAAPGHLF